MMKMLRNVLTSVLMGIGLIPLTNTVQATEYTWVGPTYSEAGDISWTNTVNWSPSGYPNSSNDVAIFPTRIKVALAGTNTVGEVRKTGGVAWEAVELNGPGTLKLEGMLLMRGRPFKISCNVIPADVPITVADGTLIWSSASVMDQIILTNSALTYAQYFGQVDVYGAGNTVHSVYGQTVSSTINLYDATLSYGMGGNVPYVFSGSMQEQSGPSTVTLIHGYKEAQYTSASEYSGVTVIKGSASTGEGAPDNGRGAIWAKCDGVFGTSDIVMYPDLTSLRLCSPNSDMIADTANLYLTNSVATNCFIWIEAGVIEQIEGLYVNGVKQPDGYYGSVTSSVVHAELDVNTNFASYFPDYASWGSKVCSGVLYATSPPAAGTVVSIR